MRKIFLFCVLTAFIATNPGIATAEHKIRVVGSSTVYPFAKKVAEHFSKMTGHEIPWEESTGTGEGFRRFCEGTGGTHPDIANASRRVRSSEMELCAKNGVGDIVEIKFGYHGERQRCPVFQLEPSTPFPGSG